MTGVQQLQVWELLYGSILEKFMLGDWLMCIVLLGDWFGVSDIVSLSVLVHQSGCVSP